NARPHGWRGCWSRSTAPRASSAPGGRGRARSSARSVPRAPVVSLDVVRGELGRPGGHRVRIDRVRAGVVVLDGALAVGQLVAAVEGPKTEALQLLQDAHAGNGTPVMRRGRGRVRGGAQGNVPTRAGAASLRLLRARAPRRSPLPPGLVTPSATRP